MKSKYLFLILIALFLIAAVSASEEIKYSDESKNISVEGINFAVPEGFGQSKDLGDFAVLESYGPTCLYTNESGDKIVITVVSNLIGINIDEIYHGGAVESTINGHDGWKYTQDGMHFFGYLHNGKGVLVGCTDEKRLPEIIL